MEDDVRCFVGFALFEGFAAAEDYADSAIECGFGLFRYEIVCLLDDRSPFTVPKNRPRNTAIFQLANGDLAGESAIGLIEDVLCGDFDALAKVLAGEEQVEGGRGDDDFGFGIAGGVVEVRDDFFDLGDCAVPATSYGGLR